MSLFAYDKITLKSLNVNKRRQDIHKKCLVIKKVRGETINWGILKQEMEQGWCWGLSEAIANNGVHWTSTR